MAVFISPPRKSALSSATALGSSIILSLRVAATKAHGGVPTLPLLEDAIRTFGVTEGVCGPSWPSIIATSAFTCPFHRFDFCRFRRFLVGTELELLKVDRFLQP